MTRGASDAAAQREHVDEARRGRRELRDDAGVTQRGHLLFGGDDAKRGHLALLGSRGLQHVGEPWRARRRGHAGVERDGGQRMLAARFFVTEDLLDRA